MLNKSKYEINKVYKYDGAPFYYIKINIGTEFYVIGIYGEFPERTVKKYGEFTENEVDDFLDTILLNEEDVI